MREILFRGKCITNNEWVYGFSFITKKGKYNIKWYDLHYGSSKTSEVDPETVGEFTGLLDKDNNRIFEGDILLFGDARVVVYWDGERFSWMAKKVFEYPYRKFPDYDDWDYIDLGWIASEIPCLGKMTTQIVGNLYDNPELLEV